MCPCGILHKERKGKREEEKERKKSHKEGNGLLIES